MSKEKIQAAKAAFEANVNLNTVFITSDLFPFARHSDARSHTFNLKLDEISEFHRSEVLKEEKPKPANAADLIALIEAAESLEAIDELLTEGEKRATVLAAIEKRKAELSNPQ